MVVVTFGKPFDVGFSLIDVIHALLVSCNFLLLHFELVEQHAAKRRAATTAELRSDVCSSVGTR